MDQPTIVSQNAWVRQQFSRQCHLLTSQINQLQTRNERLSCRLEDLIDKNTLLINRIKDALAR